MKKFLLKYGSFLAAFAMFFTTLTANSTCAWVTYQEELPNGNIMICETIFNPL